MVSNLSEDRDPNSASLSDYSQLQISSFLKKLSNRLNINQLTSCLLNIDDSNPHITQFQAFIEQIKNRFSISNEEILEYLQSNKVERIIDVINNDADNNIGQKEEYSDDGSVHSWGNSSTPAFNDFVGLREIKRKLGSEECKSAQLIPNKNQDCYSFQKNI